jgi:hypothetical protein
VLSEQLDCGGKPQNCDPEQGACDPTSACRHEASLCPAVQIMVEPGGVVFVARQAMGGGSDLFGVKQTCGLCDQEYAQVEASIRVH